MALLEENRKNSSPKFVVIVDARWAITTLSLYTFARCEKKWFSDYGILPPLTSPIKVQRNPPHGNTSVVKQYTMIATVTGNSQSVAVIL